MRPIAPDDTADPSLQATLEAGSPEGVVAADAPLRFAFQNSYARLPQHFHAPAVPTRVAEPRLIKLNTMLAEYLRLRPETLASPRGVRTLAGNEIAEGAEPLALAYAGHQFGHFVPQLGDGRAILLGEVLAEDGRRFDIQLKGSGRTAFSRGGDGRAALGPVLREYLVSEAMAALGVPTTRALAAVATGEPVYRETPLPGAVLTRVAASHMRVGTFQFFAARQDTEALRRLANYALERHYPEIAGAAQPYLALLRGVVGRHARLVAQWLCLGFVHGVMNTDNTSISGETLDYGPCAFLEAYNPETVFSAIDRNGRYAFGNQPNMALWNMTRLAEALLPLLELEHGGQEQALAAATEALGEFEGAFRTAHLAGLRRKLGLHTEADGDAALIDELFLAMAAGQADFTLVFRRLSDAAADSGRDGEVAVLFLSPEPFTRWAERWHARLRAETRSAEQIAGDMRAVNPVYIPRNHLVEAALQAAATRKDYQPFEDLLAVVTSPFVERNGLQDFAAPARAEERVTQTFCGT